MPKIYSQCFIGIRLTQKDGNANTVQEFEARIFLLFIIYLIMD